MAQPMMQPMQPMADMNQMAQWMMMMSGGDPAFMQKMQDAYMANVAKQAP